MKLFLTFFFMMIFLVLGLIVTKIPHIIATEGKVSGAFMIGLVIAMSGLCVATIRMIRRG